MIFVGETDPLPVAAENVKVRAAAKRSGGEGWRQVACIERFDDAGLHGIDDDSATAAGGVGPFRRRVLGALDENDFLRQRMAGGDTALRAVLRLIKKLHFTGAGVDAFDPVAVECGAVGIRADVVNDPLPVRAPNGSVGEQVVLRGGGDLSVNGHDLFPMIAGVLLLII